MESRSRNRIVRFAAVVAGALLPAALALGAGPPTWGTQAQATRGHQLFNNYCAQCHRPDLTGAAGPALIGKKFEEKWFGKPLSALYTFEHEKMPAVNPGSVPPDQLWPITAYILQKNGFPMGSTGLGDAASAQVLAR